MRLTANNGRTPRRLVDVPFPLRMRVDLFSKAANHRNVQTRTTRPLEVLTDAPRTPNDDAVDQLVHKHTTGSTPVHELRNVRQLRVSAHDVLLGIESSHPVGWLRVLTFVSSTTGTRAHSKRNVSVHVDAASIHLLLVVLDQETPGNRPDNRQIGRLEFAFLRAVSVVRIDHAGRNADCCECFWCIFGQCDGRFVVNVVGWPPDRRPRCVAGFFRVLLHALT